MSQYNMEELTTEAIEMLNRRGVELEDIGELVLFLQKQYYPDLTLEFCIENLKYTIKLNIQFVHNLFDNF